MSRNEASVEIDRPAADVFPWLVERERRLRWVEGLESSEPLDGDEPRAGSRFRETIAQQGLRTTVETTIERFEPPHAIDLAVTHRAFEARTETRLESVGTMTRVTSTIDSKVNGLAGRVVGGVVTRQAQGSLERSLARLKELVEAG